MTKTPPVEANPDIPLLKRGAEINRYVAAYVEAAQHKPTVLDIGGGKSRGFKHAPACNVGLSEARCIYHVLDIDPDIKPWKNLITADILDCADVVADASFDITFSNNALEHMLEPWVACEQQVRITKTGGLIIAVAPFAWRYHPTPLDCFRFTHVGLAHLFTRTGHVTPEVAGYDITRRRDDSRGGKHPLGYDRPPVDDLGGWREHWHTLFIGRKSGV